MKKVVKAGVKAAVQRAFGEADNVVSREATLEDRPPVGQAKLAVDPVKVPLADTSAIEEPKARRVVTLKVLQQDHEAAKPDTSDRVRIMARVSRDNRQCDFLVDRAVLPSLSWRFPDGDSAVGSPLAEALFAHPEVAWIQIDESIVKIARRSGKEGDWRPLSIQLGETIRTQMSGGEPSVNPDLFEGLPEQEELVRRLQEVIDTEVNPGVAAHDGHVSLERIRGNAVHVSMGGGCQGCSAAALTLKFGIYKAFRDAVPQLGAIYDETDHAAGENPFYQ
jgi:Fe-S cluster biogenesis protein NfuA